MPVVSDTTIPYEILLRFDEAGLLSAAHYQKRRTVTLDGEKLLDQVCDPVPLSLVGAEDKVTLAAALGDAVIGAVAAADKAAAALIDLQRQVSDAEGAATAARSGMEAEQGRADELQAEITRLTQAAAAAEAAAVPVEG